MYTNNKNIPLSLSVWLVQDDYDFSNEPNVISATTLLKPLRAVVLGIQNKDLEKTGDISSLLSSRMGTSLHAGIEKAWSTLEKVKTSLALLGYPDSVIDRVKINPKDSELEADTLPIYMEQRVQKKVGNYLVSGKYDFVFNGAVEDFKSTKAYSYMMQSNNDNYIKQGSIYRWLNPNIITSDLMHIRYIFTDWNKLESIKNPTKYPQHAMLSQTFQLMSIQETDNFVTQRVHIIDTLKDANQDVLPLCTKEELWVKPSVWKYYKNPAKTDRSTKNFDTAHEANMQLSSDGNVGVVKEVQGEVMRCKYCNVVNICYQAQDLIKAGLLTL